jgi:hypothetical protein
MNEAQLYVAVGHRGNGPFTFIPSTKNLYGIFG